MSGIDISTPKSSPQINIIAKDLRSMDPAYRSPTFRSFQSKLGKALDEAIVKISTLSEERDQLAAALERQRPQKRRKVRETAQEAFVRIADVRKVKEDMASSSDTKGKGRATKRYVVELEVSEESDSEPEDCITVL